MSEYIHRPADDHAPSRLYDRRFAVLFLAQIFFVIANVMLAHYARWVDFLGGSVRDVGWVMGVGAAIGLAVRPWIGQWINRVGARNVWAAGLLLSSASVAGNIIVHDVGVGLYVFRIGFMIGTGLIMTGSLTYIAQRAPHDRQAEAIGVFGSAGLVAMIFAPFLGDLILGPGPRTRERFIIFLATAAFALLAGWLLLLTDRSAQIRSRAAPIRLVDFLSITRRHWPGSILLVNCAFGMCATIPFGFLAAFVDSERIASWGVPPVGLFFIFYAGCALVTRLSLRSLPDRIGYRRVVVAGQLIYAAGVFSFLLVDGSHASQLLIPALVCGTGHAFMFPTLNALVLRDFPHDVRGTGSALSMVFTDLGAVAGAPILGTIAYLFGYGALFVTAGSVVFSSAIFFAWRSWLHWSGAQQVRHEPWTQVADAPLPANASIEPRKEQPAIVAEHQRDTYVEPA